MVVAKLHIEGGFDSLLLRPNLKGGASGSDDSASQRTFKFQLLAQPP